MQLMQNSQQSVLTHFKTIARDYAVNPTEVTAGFYPPLDKARKYAIGSLVHWEFSKLINILPVVDRDGSSFLGCLGDPATGRTDVSEKDRETHPLLAKPLQYRTVKTDTDIHIPYAALNQWALGNFTENYNKFVTTRLGLDRLIIGWQGESQDQKNTDITTDALMTNVNKGWLQVMREQHPSNIIGDKLSNPITFGVGGDYESLDQAVLDMVQFIPEVMRDGLGVLVGESLLQWEQQRIYNNQQIEKQKTADTFNIFGNLPRMSCPGFPSLGLVITSPDNLSIYWKEGSYLRQTQHVAKRERVEDYHSREEAYVVENAKKFIALEPKAISFVGTPANDAQKAAQLLDENNNTTS